MIGWMTTQGKSSNGREETPQICWLRRKELQEALSPAIVAFDLLDVVDEAARNKPALKDAVKISMRSLSLKEQNVISNWVATLVDLVTPKGK